MERPADRGHRQNQEAAYREAADDVIRQIGEKRFAEYLLAVQPEDSFQRNKNSYQQHQPDTQPQEIHRYDKKMPRNVGEDFHLWANSGRGTRKEPKPVLATAY